jgi:hypothetical protein
MTPAHDFILGSGHSFCLEFIRKRWLAIRITFVKCLGLPVGCRLEVMLCIALLWILEAGTEITVETSSLRIA